MNLRSIIDIVSQRNYLSIIHRIWIHLNREPSILLYISRALFFFFIAGCYSTVWIYNVLFVYEILYGYLDYFQLWGIANKPGKETFIYRVLYELKFPLLFYFINTSSEMAGSYDRSLFTYYVKLLSKQWYHFTFPPTGYECASFSTSPSTCLIISVFNFSHSNMNVMVSCGFNLYSLIINDIWHHFMCLFIIYISSMVKIHVFIFMCLFVIYLSSVVKCLFLNILLI